VRNPVAVSRKAAVTVALFLAFSFALPGAAHAEGGLLGAIFNAIGRVIAPPPHRTEQPLESFPDIFNSSGAAVKPAEGGPRVSYCVRSCDGRYFPMAKNAGSVSPAKMCQSMCPAAETAIYSGSNIENATSHDGKKYGALANAFLYRTKIVAGCSCNSKSPVGNASINYQNDPTLRPGDIVMTEEGPVVFKGAVGPTHKLSDFVPVRDSKRISSSTREKVIAMRIMPARRNITAQNAPNAVEAVKTLPANSSKALGYAAD
jgi:hypothetical protein